MKSGEVRVRCGVVWCGVVRIEGVRDVVNEKWMDA